MNDLLQYAASVELAARDLMVPVCGFGVAWCVIGAEAVLALIALAAIGRWLGFAVAFALGAVACLWIGGPALDLLGLALALTVTVKLWPRLTHLMRLVFGFIWALVLVLTALSYASADDIQTDANVITGLDVSSSINAQETMLQIEGMARAIKSPAVVAAIGQGEHGRIGFHVFVWADGDYPELVSWRVIASQADADAAAAEILGRLQSLIDSTGGAGRPSSAGRSVGTLTNLSGALDHAAELLKAAPFRARRAVVNIVGNGEDNVGEDPERARADLLAAGATINGVVVGGDPAVLNYYRAEVIGGRAAFVLPADKAEILVQVLAMKFVSEISMVD